MSEPPLIPVDESAFTPLVQVAEAPEPDTVLIDDDGLSFDDRHREDFIGLLYVGQLEKEVRVAGHRFLLRTPGQRDRLEMGPVHKPWLNTLTAERAWMAVTVAAYVQRIDSEDAPEPLNKNVSLLRARLEWIQATIESEHVIERIYNECLLLDARVRELIDELDEQGKG